MKHSSSKYLRKRKLRARLPVSVHSNFVCDSPKWRTVPVSISRRLEEQTVVYTYNGILLSYK